MTKYYLAVASIILVWWGVCLLIFTAVACFNTGLC